MIENKTIGPNSPAFIIAEIGVNHEGDIDKAKALIELAASAGADAVKFQIYKAEELSTKDSPAYWEGGLSQYESFKEIKNFSESDYKSLADYAKENDLIFFASAFDEESVNLLFELKVPLFKIASGEITNTPLIKHIALRHKPMIISTGGATIQEIEDVVNCCKNLGNDQVILLHCMLSYPTDYSDANLLTISELKKCFPNNIIGYSDHTLSGNNDVVGAIAVSLGAKVIEKHFTLKKIDFPDIGATDHFIAADPKDLRTYIDNIRLTEKLLGSPIERPNDIEKGVVLARRSIVSKKMIFKGEIILREHLTTKRPGTGIEPKYIDKIVGRRAAFDIDKDKIITWKDIE